MHDVIEDTEESIGDFPKEVIALVMKLTHEGGRKNSKIDAIERLRGDREAIMIKIADRLHNLSDALTDGEEYARRESVRKATMLLLEIAVEANLEGTPLFAILLDKYYSTRQGRSQSE